MRGIPTVSLSGNPLFKEFLVDMAVLPKFDFMQRYGIGTNAYWELFFQFDLDELEEVVRKSLSSLFTESGCIRLDLFRSVYMLYSDRLITINLIKLGYEKDFCCCCPANINGQYVCPN